MKQYPVRAGLADWFGTIPNHWQLRPSFGAFTPLNHRNKRLEEKTVLSLSYGKIVVRPTERLTGLVPSSFEGYQIVDPGDIVIRTTDLQNDHTSLRIGIVRNRGVITSAYLALRIKQGVDPRYGFLVLTVWDSSKAIYGFGSGLRQGLAFEHFKRMPIPVPPLEEQEAIVRFLDWAHGRLERVIRGKRKVIALLTEQKQAIIHRAVTRGLDSTVPLKPSGIPWLGDIPVHWDAVTLKAVCAIQSGITVGKDNSGKKLSELPYLRVANVQAGYVNLRSVKSILVSAEDANRFRLVKGDVLLTEGGDIDKLGRGGVWDGSVDPCLHQNHVFAVRPDQSILVPEYFALTLQTAASRAYFESTAKQTTNLASTNRATIGRFKFALPSVDSQREILARLNSETTPITVAIKRLHSEIHLLTEYQTRLTADVVTGKLDVREAAKNLPVESEIDLVDDVTNDDELDIDDEEAVV